MNEQEKGRGERRRQARGEGSLKRNNKNKKGTKGQTRRIENKKQKERKEEEGGISLPGRGPRQTLEAWLRVSGEDDVLG